MMVTARHGSGCPALKRAEPFRGSSLDRDRKLKTEANGSTPYATDRSIYSRECAMRNSEVAGISVIGSFPIRYGYAGIRHSELIDTHPAF